MHWIATTTSLLLLVQLSHCSAVEYNSDQANKTENELLGCLKTSNTDEIRRMRLNIFKQELLLRLNLDKEPENPAPEVVQMYKDQLRTAEYKAVRASHQLQDKEIRPCVEVDKRISRLVVFFPNKVETEISGADNAGSLIDTLRFTFTVDLVGHQEVTEADLRLFKLVVADNTTVTSEERVDIYNIYSDVQYYYDEDLKYHAVAGNVKTDKDGYTIFNIADAIEDWKAKTPLLQGELTLQVELRTKDNEGFSLAPKIQFVSDNATTQLVIRTLLDRPKATLEGSGVVSEESTETESNTEVRKRNANDNNDQILNCALQSLVIDFKADLNWTWVLHPEQVTLNFCSGLCGRANAENMHTEYLSIRSAVVSNPVGALEPCCIPNSYESATLSLAVPGPEKTILEKVPKLTITSCVCR